MKRLDETLLDVIHRYPKMHEMSNPTVQLAK